MCLEKILGIKGARASLAFLLGPKDISPTVIFSRPRNAAVRRRKRKACSCLIHNFFAAAILSPSGLKNFPKALFPERANEQPRNLSWKSSLHPLCSQHATVKSFLWNYVFWVNRNAIVHSTLHRFLFNPLWGHNY